MAHLGMQRFVDPPKTLRVRTSPTFEQLLQGDASRWPSCSSPTLGKHHDQEDDHGHHNKKSVLTKVKEKAIKLRHSLSKKKHGHENNVTPSWGVSLDDTEYDDEDPEYLGAPMYQSELAPEVYRETARQHPRAAPEVSEKHVLLSSVKNEAEQENEKPPSSRTITETVSEMLAPAYASVSDATQTIASKIAGLTVATPAAPETGEYAGSGTQKLDRVSETREHATGDQQTLDKSVSVKEYLMHKLEPGEDKKALSQVITDAISPRKTSGDIGIVEKVKEAVTSLLRNEESSQLSIKITNSSSHIPFSTNAQETLGSLHFIILLSIKLLAVAQDENQFIYNGFRGANLHLDGIAKIHSSGLLQLTNSSRLQSGHAFYQLPLKFNTSKSLSFSTNFVFAIVPEWVNLSGHGMAFTISPSLDFKQAVASQYLGLFNTSNNGLSSNHVLAVELDTVMNTEFEDINDNHVGIDINGLKSIVSAPVTYFSSTEGTNKSLELMSGNPIQVWIEYDEVEMLLNVTIAPIRTPKPIRPLLSTPINLSQILLDSMYVGFSSATATLTSKHYVLGWSFNRSGQAQNLELSKLPKLPRQRKSRKKLGLEIAVSLMTMSILLILTGTVYVMRKKKFEETREDWEMEYGPQRFSYKDLYKATKGFKDKKLLGAGGFGKVYRGVLSSSNNMEVAIKKVSHDSKQGMKEFVNEVSSMGRLRHRNLVQLLGYCRRKGELLLVYDYMLNGSLDKFLFSNEKPNLNWAQRYRILRGIASGLLYLHEEWEQVVLHRDVKASNVLLDADLNGRLGDFGLARLYDHEANFQTTHVVGTVGYLAPELTRTGKASTRTDVFAFGAFLLEVACGRRPIELTKLPEEIILVDWVYETWKQGAILETSDPRLEGDYVTEEMELVLKLGLLCSHPNPAARPSMRQVMQYLDGDAILPEILLESVGVGMVIMGNEASAEFGTSLPSTSGKTPANVMSITESIFISGR
ncbi:hypothetical protein F0562_021986 [Nyssa sinensis]|uniref:non-specific serine/threonine protein kinase n=1 Tax=Nyssa sinensis TaxID=561372 RepID=A0A5J5BPX2_9ASTE|nr:hypothetical protein F0562_021986 [Nyssa sinensis]